jgi:hypothetical protein
MVNVLLPGSPIHAGLHKQSNLTVYALKCTSAISGEVQRLSLTSCPGMIDGKHGPTSILEFDSGAYRIVNF